MASGAGDTHRTEDDEVDPAGDAAKAMTDAYNEGEEQRRGKDDYVCDGEVPPGVELHCDEEPWLWSFGDGRFTGGCGGLGVDGLDLMETKKRGELEEGFEEGLEFMSSPCVLSKGDGSVA